VSVHQGNSPGALQFDWRLPVFNRKRSLDTCKVELRFVHVHVAYHTVNPSIIHPLIPP
jgi:hypothetical protein